MKRKTAVVYTPKYLKHDTGQGHPESPNRLKVIIKELRRSGVLERCLLSKPGSGDVEDAGLIHEYEYIKMVELCCGSEGCEILDSGDTMVCPDSFKVALLAVAGAIRGVDLVMADRVQNAFALVRPPGHHAGPYYARGFCLFNNVAVAAAYLLNRLHLNRVLILDVDAHHGNGTQEIFYLTDKVLYISLHQDPTEFPGTGFLDEVGEGEGYGYTVNIPFPFQIDDQIYIKAFNEIVVPIIKRYRPQFILVSAGFDGHYADPVGELSLSGLSYLKVFEKAMRLASQFCGGKLVAVLEGGYNLNILGKLVTATIAKMADIPYQIREKRVVASYKIKKETEKALKEVKDIHSSFWKL